VEIFPLYENGNWGLAKTLEESGRIEEARKAFEVASDRFPDSYPVAYHRAAFLEEHGTLEEAEDAWDDAVENGDGAVSARLAHARVLRKLGREEEAWDEARWALVNDPANGEARRFLAEGYERAGRTIAAGAEWTRAVRANPQDQILASELLEYAVRHPESRFRALLCVPGIRRGIPKSDVRLAKALAAFGA
jgi:tetratricopeptide (TPR) repeat protein